MDNDTRRAGESSATPTVLGKRDRPSHGSGNISPGNETPTKWFRCNECDKSYSRVDHLARHVRQHTQERPYVCDVCHKGFARADLLKRHASVHSAPDGSGAPRKPNRQGRVNQACIACAELHLKCDNDKPCQRCKTKNIHCQYQSRQADDEAVAHDLLSLSQRPVQASDFNRPSLSSPPTQGVNFTQNLVVPGDPTSIQRAHDSSAFYDNATAQIPDVSNNLAAFSNDFDGSDLRDFLQNVMGQEPYGVRTGLQSGTWTPRNLFEYGINTDLELDELDRDFLADYSMNNPFGVTPDTSTSYSVADTSSEHPIGGIEPIQKASTWRFRPVSRDSRDNHLTLPSGDSSRRLVVSRRVTKEPLSYITRDAMLGLITALRFRPLDPATSSTLPSVELLDSLLQFQLASNPTSSQLVHIATYEPSAARPELTMCLIAAGAVSTPDKHLRKLGFALQEATRGAIAVALESDNTLVRHVDVLQAAVLSVNIGLWSGNSRKMEIAEAFIQVWVTCLRRGGWFRRKYDQNNPVPEDTGPVLEAKWQAWAIEESQKRLVFYLFALDTQASISLLINPVISYADLHLPLPYPQDLWSAKSAQRWKDLFLTKYQYLAAQPPSMIDLFRRVDQLANFQSIADDHIALRALMCASWAMVREYRQQSAMQPPSQSQSHWSGGSASLLLGSRLAEIKQLIECLRMSYPAAADSALFLEIQSMHLYISLDDVHVFAGIEGQEEARRAYPALVDWVRTPAARQAVWHAGQILKYATQIPAIRDFEAVAVYQAGLTLWSYGVISNASVFQSSEAGQGCVPANGEFIAINGFETQDTQRFLAVNRGSPGLAGLGRNGSERTLLSNPGAVMTRLVEMLRASHRTTSVVPPLLENLVELIGNLGAAVSGGQAG